jgi:multicomponent K+:H+ antiporter subunit D
VTALLEWFMPHLVVAPILLPMATAAVMLVMGEGRRPWKVVLGTGSMLAGLATAVALLWWTSARGPVTYVPGGWPTAAGIAVVADRLSALMLVLAWILGPSAVVFSAARWHRAGVHFQPLLQLQLMGLSGAFLAGDLFNLFVFFEILLAASYGLLLHGSGKRRIVAGLRYVAVNLTASSLFLVGAAMLYGVTGTLNLAALAEHLAAVGPEDRGLLEAGAGILAAAFLAKAAAWPLNFWLVRAYSTATAPAAAVFAILTKVGVYALLRTSTVLAAGGAATSLGGDALVLFGAVTAALAAFGMLGTLPLARLAGLSVIVSSGTLLTAIGLGRPAVTGGALLYLASSTLAASALFLLVDVLDRWRNAGVTRSETAPFLTPRLEERDVNLDDEEEPLVGRPIPASTALLGFAFLACALLVAGLPPLSGFVGKVAILSGAFSTGGDEPSFGAWVLLAVVLGTGLLSLVALTRAGIRTFWSGSTRDAPHLRVAEAVPLIVLLAACVGLTVAAGPASRFALETARALHAPRDGSHAVLGAEARAP